MMSNIDVDLVVVEKKVVEQLISALSDFTDYADKKINSHSHPPRMDRAILPSYQIVFDKLVTAQNRLIESVEGLNNTIL
jgi:hypothetical protein